MIYGIPEPGSYFRVPEDADTSRDNALEFVRELCEEQPSRLNRIARLLEGEPDDVDYGEDRKLVWAEEMKETHLELDGLERWEVLDEMQAMLEREECE